MNLFMEISDAWFRENVGFVQSEGLPIQVCYWRKVVSNMGSGDSIHAVLGDQIQIEMHREGDG